MEAAPSIVEYLYEQGGHRPFKCGYCKSPDTSYNQGVWGFRMNCEDFQGLVDRGFQRSGKFVYKPVMKRTCCPQYVIRMDVKNFKLSKSHKSSIRKFKRFLLEGQKGSVLMEALPGNSSVTSTPADVTSTPTDSGLTVDLTDLPFATKLPGVQSESTSKATALSVTTQRGKEKKPVKAGLGPDPQKPPCKKAKIIRKERKEQRLQTLLQQGVLSEKPPTKIHSSPTRHSDTNSQQFCQDLEKVLAFPESEDHVHRFKTKLIRLDSKDFTDTYDESFQVFKKFQTVIHKESDADSGEKQFNEFLVYTPLKYQEGSGGMATSFGTYHLHYLLDGKIFAVGVLDILPKGVVCEYLYYDPDYRFLTPGVMTAVLEIMLTQQFYIKNPAMQYYYMGFYVQSCPKMNYKRRYSASALLCPETFTYVPLDICIPKLKASEYSRLAAADVKDVCYNCTEDELSGVPVLADMTAMPYVTYTVLHGDHAKSLLEEYVDLVGLELAFKMRLFMGGRVATLGN